MLPDSASALTRDKLDTATDPNTTYPPSVASTDAISALGQPSVLPNRPSTAREPLPPSHHRRDDYPLPHSSHANLDSFSRPTQQPSRQPHPQTEGRKASKSGFFHFSKGPRVATQPLPATEPLLDKQQDHAAAAAVAAPRSGDPATTECPGGSVYGHDDLQRPNLPFSSQSQVSLSSAGDTDSATTASSKQRKVKPFGRLGRSKSNRDKDRPSPKAAPTTLPTTPSVPILYDNFAPLRTAPVAQDRAFRDMMNSSIRNRSEDRALTRNGSASRENLRDNTQKMHSSSYKDNGGSTFLSGLRGSRAADIFSKGLFGKSTRSGSTTDREPAVDDEHYVLKVINLPLVEQTRLTRISKRLEHSRDKTEFWMPAFPWRAIDYLNYKGCDVEGLYRVPGSGPQIKKWQRRFDEQHDVNLFEVDDLYDINIVGSMLKAWLRELPDELFPKESQDRIARECAGSEEVPQLLIDELANLSPFNYYLLFAITCHLSLLLAHSDKNKMDFRNLCICFQPCMKIDAFCFRFLVCDWRNCWKGCKNEAKYIEEEYKRFDQPPPRGLAEPAQLTSNTEVRNASPPRSKQDAKEELKLNDVPAPGGRPNDSESIGETNGAHEARPKTADMRPLSPIKPLSPLGF
ncbi:rho GTPase activator [Cordyceps fumosorosea ARSEF 2679]|uniref:Rho GTPase activator n=1 Tax=Cordyceps fumosorosea (strain ARSEF 2679) TaxID=1081104 RepID=A0A162JIM0_CORFA|nr:rho GTPase activator [Cordyceps fumosorosea ARSEF 2679]OAA69552.1 rho GTPase activator [Cordyceps fumosorosea ARSEF 2679]